MPTYATWVLTALAGFLISGGNILGAILGLALGVMYTTAFRQNIQQGAQPRDQSQDFSHVLLVLTANIMKADGKLMRSELDYIRDFFIRRLGPDKTQELMVRLRELLNEDFSISEVCRSIRMNMIYPMWLELLHFLFGIAAADGDVNPNEKYCVNESITCILLSATLETPTTNRFLPLLRICWREGISTGMELPVSRTTTGLRNGCHALDQFLIRGSRAGL